VPGLNLEGTKRWILTPSGRLVGEGRIVGTNGMRSPADLSGQSQGLG
jgi:hypothetical protein